ncbi:MAG: 1,6-anhydro-N-acetylmuramyl-L-alanine amidase AmpD [Gammaproteobacteria bacterium]|nr:1,6-anhydro-N-acetylmuramyl-L-alanine amidase AmpD [Gammaproteobacteria bacterium]
MNDEGLIWLDDVIRVVSPNADERPPGSEIELLVIHNISLPPNEFGGGNIHRLFTNRLDPAAHPYFASIADLRVSAHLLIERDGRTTQFVALERRAWHAGQSQFCGRERCNDFSIGIELEGTDELPFSDAQYERLVALTRTIRRIFPRIGDDNIVGHSDIAPGRKTDPGPFFAWDRFRTQLAAAETRPPALG